MGGGQQPAAAGDGVSRVYSPYNPADDPVLKAPTAGGMNTTRILLGDPAQRLISACDACGGVGSDTI